MYVIGTAGHVDHGKSSLVRALTGIDPDRLKEEKAREMTIDLGFAWLGVSDLDPLAQSIAIVDVPGHRDFIENMLAGVGSINAVLFVVAADEGAMPQTREHLAIVDLLQIPTGVIALTKTDLASDERWLELVELDLADLMTGTVLEGAPVIPVSARTGHGLPALKSALLAQLGAQPAPRDVGLPRLWVDRVFSVSGFGTVVTGTLLDGQLVPGQEIRLLPEGLTGRVRGLQSHNHPIEVARPGNRVAVNIAGVEKRDARRGQLLTVPGSGTILPTFAAAVRYRHLPSASRPLKHHAEVKVYTGSAETIARVRLLDAEAGQLAPGAEGWLQLVLRDPLPLRKGDRYILRFPSPGETIGGGEVIDPAMSRRLRRSGLQAQSAIARLEALSRGDPRDLVRQAVVNAGGPINETALASLTGLDAATVQAVLQDAHGVDNEGGLIPLGDQWWIDAAALDLLLEKLVRALEGYHRAEPLHPGMRLDRLRSQLRLGTPELDMVILAAQSRGLVAQLRPDTLAKAGHAFQPTRSQQNAIERLKSAFAAAPYTPPSVKEASAIVGEDVLTALVEWGELVRISPEVALTPAVFQEFIDTTVRIIEADRRITLKTLRDQFDTSRKYAQAVLEYFDSQGITRRVGDDHVAGSGDWARLRER